MTFLDTLCCEFIAIGMLGLKDRMINILLFIQRSYRQAKSTPRHCRLHHSGYSYPGSEDE